MGKRGGVAEEIESEKKREWCVYIFISISVHQSLYVLLGSAEACLCLLSVDVTRYSFCDSAEFQFHWVLSMSTIWNSWLESTQTNRQQRSVGNIFSIVLWNSYWVTGGIKWWFGSITVECPASSALLFSNATVGAVSCESHMRNARQAAFDMRHATDLWPSKPKRLVLAKRAIYECNCNISLVFDIKPFHIAGPIAGWTSCSESMFIVSAARRLTTSAYHMASKPR